MRTPLASREDSQASKNGKAKWHVFFFPEARDTLWCLTVFLHVFCPSVRGVRDTLWCLTVFDLLRRPTEDGDCDVAQAGEGSTATRLLRPSGPGSARPNGTSSFSRSFFCFSVRGVRDTLRCLTVFDGIVHFPFLEMRRPPKKSDGSSCPPFFQRGFVFVFVFQRGTQR